MKTETTTYRRQSTSSRGAAWSSDTSAPDCTANLIKNCLILTEPVIVGRHEINVVPSQPFAIKTLVLTNQPQA